MKRRRKILIILGVVLAVAIVIPVIRHYQLRAAVESYIAELKTKGELMELSQVIPPPVPPEKNAAPLITNALTQLESHFESKGHPHGMRMIIPGKAVACWRKEEVYDVDFRLTNTWKNFGATLEKDRKDLAQLRELFKRPILDFGLDYQTAFDQPAYDKNFRFYRLSEFKYAALRLTDSVIYNLHRGDITAACEDFRVILALVKGDTGERVEISQLVRMAIAQMSAPAVWEILQAADVSDKDLAQLQQDWSSLEFVSPLRDAFLVERVKGLQLQNDLRHSWSKLAREARPLATSMEFKSVVKGKLTEWDGSSTNMVLVPEEYTVWQNKPFFAKATVILAKLWRTTTWSYFDSYQDELLGLREWQIMFTAMHMVETNGSFHRVESFITENFTKLGFNSVTNDAYAIYSRNAFQLAALRKAVRAEVARNVLIAAIALKRYELRHHQFPSTLDELTPEFLKAVPIDCMDGQPLRYRRNADGTYLLYSVGKDGKDDGGDPSFAKEDRAIQHSLNWLSDYVLDWVWPQPATEAEAQKYYEEQAKKSK